MWFIYEARHIGRPTQNPEKCNDGTYSLSNQDSERSHRCASEVASLPPTPGISGTRTGTVKATWTGISLNHFANTEIYF